MVRTLALTTALLLAAPALAKPAPEAAETEETEEVVHETHDPVHVPAETMAEWLPDDHTGLAQLQTLYADFVDDELGQDGDANEAMLHDVKPAELGVLHEKAMGIVQEGEDTHPSAAAFVLASAMLAYADLAYSMRPTEDMKERQAEKFWEILETEVWPSFAPVDRDARKFLVSIEKGAQPTSPWKARAAELIAKLDAAGRGSDEEAAAAPEPPPEEPAEEPAETAAETAESPEPAAN